jgi:hypothetical protein
MSTNTPLLPFVYAVPPGGARLLMSVQTPGEAGRVRTETFDLGKLPSGCVTLQVLREGESLLEPFDGRLSPPQGIQRKTVVKGTEESLMSSVPNAAGVPSRADILEKRKLKEDRKRGDQVATCCLLLYRKLRVHNVIVAHEHGTLGWVLRRCELLLLFLLLSLTRDTSPILLGVAAAASQRLQMSLACPTENLRAVVLWALASPLPLARTAVDGRLALAKAIRVFLASVRAAVRTVDTEVVLVVTRAARHFQP